MKNLKNHIRISILFFILAITSISAKNLGVWGTLFSVEEQDIREFIYQRLNEMEKNGEMTKLKEKFTKDVKEHILRPAPVTGLTVIESAKETKKTKKIKGTKNIRKIKNIKDAKSIESIKKPRMFYYDPTYVLDRDIEDHKGNIIAKKETVINPLDTVTMHGILFFLDADDKRQIRWALNHTKEIKKTKKNEKAIKYDRIKYVLVKGNIKDAGKKLNDRIYFDQYGLITKKLGIKHIPCTVKQEKKRLLIQEFALEEDDGRR